MLTTTRDPITGRDITDLSHAPFVIEGRGESALRIYFESEATRDEYLATEPRAIDESLARAYAGTVGIAREM